VACALVGGRAILLARVEGGGYPIHLGPSPEWKKFDPERSEDRIYLSQHTPGGEAMVMNYRGFRIKELHAIVGIDPNDDEEGIPAVETPGGMLPLIASDAVRLDQLKRLAQKIANQTKQNFKVVKFSAREDIEEITCEGDE
jgi:hypothetical protein